MEPPALRPTLDALLGPGLVERAQAAAGRPAPEPGSSALGRGAGALGLLAALAGRRRLASGPARGALVAVGLGLLGKLAFDAWSRRGGTVAQRALADLHDEPEAERRAATMLHAMVAAAKADGHVDEEEESAIAAEIEDLPGAAASLLRRALAAPLSPEEVAARVEGGQEAREVYAASALLSGRDHPGEVDHLDRLARALGLSAQEAREIEDGLHAV